MAADTQGAVVISVATQAADGTAAADTQAVDGTAAVALWAADGT
jgi:hypothetical protein